MLKYPVVRWDALVPPSVGFHPDQKTSESFGINADVTLIHQHGELNAGANILMRSMTVTADVVR